MRGGAEGRKGLGNKEVRCKRKESSWTGMQEGVGGREEGKKREDKERKGEGKEGKGVRETRVTVGQVR